MLMAYQIAAKELLRGFQVNAKTCLNGFRIFTQDL